MITFNIAELLYQFILFIGLFLALRVLFFKPLGLVFDQRLAATDDMVAKAKSMEVAVEEKQLYYNDCIRKANVDAAKIKQSIIEEGLLKEESLIAHARNTASSLISECEQKMVTEMNEQKSAIGDGVDTISARIVDAILHGTMLKNTAASNANQNADAIKKPYSAKPARGQV